MSDFNRSFFIVLCLLAFSFTAVADNLKARGRVLKYSGDIEIVSAAGKSRKVRAVNEPVHENDTIVTKSQAKIVVQFDDGALSVLDEKSRMRVEQSSWFSWLGGKVYFTFKKVFGGKQRHVRTANATLGIRGTTFIISENPGQAGESVALKEGLLEVKSNGPAFEIHRQKQLDEFAAFKQEHEQARQAMQDEFDRYRQQVQTEFVEYRRQFMLQPDRVITLSGYRVDETAMSDGSKKEFEAFETEAEEILRAFRSEKD